MLITVSAILCLNGCSCLFSLGSLGAPSTYKGSISELKLDSLPPGREVVVYLPDGNRIRGEYIGLDSLGEEKDSEDEEIKIPFLAAIAVRDTLGEKLIPVDEVAQIEIKAKRTTPGQAFLAGLAIDTAIFGVFIWYMRNIFSNR